jgi:hypothetical protein
VHDLGTLVWVILVVIGVISSMVKNARKMTRQPAGASPSARPAPPPVAAPPPVPAPRPVHAQAFAMPPVIPPNPVPAPSAASTTRREPQPIAVHAVGTSPIRGMFEGPATLVRAIVAAEVLGPPKSMQEQSIWSPRHSEPSI